VGGHRGEVRGGKEQGIPEAEAVVGLDGSEGTVTLEIDDTRVTVDASMGVEKNADLLLPGGKRVEGKKEGAQAAIEDTREDLADAKARRDCWEAADQAEGNGPGEGDSEAEEGEDVDWLSMNSIPVRQTEQWYERFRWFRTSDGFPRYRRAQRRPERRTRQEVPRQRGQGVPRPGPRRTDHGAQGNRAERGREGRRPPRLQPRPGGHVRRLPTPPSGRTGSTPATCT